MLLALYEGQSAFFKANITLVMFKTHPRVIKDVEYYVKEAPKYWSSSKSNRTTMLSKHKVFFEGSPLTLSEVADFMPTEEDVPMEQVPMEPVPMEEAPAAGDQVTHNIQDDFHSPKSTSQDYRDAEKICNSYSDEVVLMAAMRVFRLRGRSASQQVIKAIMDDEDLAETLHKVI